MIEKYKQFHSLNELTNRNEKRNKQNKQRDKLTNLHQQQIITWHRANDDRKKKREKK